MTLYHRLRFAYLLRHHRYVEALALCAPLDPSMAGGRIWALYRLGCYRSVCEVSHEPQSVREIVALGASLAAVGRCEEAADLLLHVAESGKLRDHHLVEAIRAVAQYDLPLALALSEKAPQERVLRAALLLADEHHGPALDLVNAAIADGEAAAHPDIWLLKANAIRRHDAILELTNAHLAAFDLGPVALIDPQAAPGTANLQAASLGEPVHGPLVTITMPAYNTASRVGRAIESLLAQTYRDIEVVVVDDASTDNTAEVVAALAQRDQRVRLLRLPGNGGPYVARNLALKSARGEFVTCHDSDDWAHPEKIARQVAPLLADQRQVFTLSNWVRMQDDGYFYARPIYPLTRLNPASPLFRRQAVLERVGYYEQVRTGADSEYIARLKLAFGRRGWKRLKQTLVFGAHRAGSLMTDAQTGMERGRINPARIDYWENWVARLVETRRAARHKSPRHLDATS